MNTYYGGEIKYRVTIHDACGEHVSSWCTPSVEGAIHAAFVRAFGMSAGEITFAEYGHAYARGMRVEVESVSDLPAVQPRKVVRELRRAAA